MNDAHTLPTARLGNQLDSANGTPDWEGTLCALFSEVLAQDSVSADDDFFHLGGHSQLAIRLASLVRSRLGVQLSVGAIFDAPTAAELAVLMANAPQSAAPLIRRVQGGH